MTSNSKSYILKFLFFTGIMALIYQCQKVDDTSTVVDQNPEYTSQLNISIHRGDKHFAMLHRPIFLKLVNIGKEPEAFRNTQYSIDYGFTANLDAIQLIEDSLYTQYTVKVEPDVSSDNLLNYVIKVYHTGEELQYLVTYPKIDTNEGMRLDASSATLTVLQGEALSLSQRSTCANGNAPELVAVTQEYTCNTLTRCTGNNHHAEADECECGTPKYPDCLPPGAEECGWSDVNVWSCTGGGGSNGGNNGGSNGGGGTNNNNNNPPDDDDDDDGDKGDDLITIPLDPEDFEDPHNNHCVELKKITDNADIKHQLELLKLDAADANIKNEKGFSLKMTASGIDRGPMKSPQYGSVTFIPYAYVFGAAHMHDLKGNPMFSAMDLFALKKHADAFAFQGLGGDIISLPVYILVTASGTYAIKINDVTAIQEYFDKFPTKSHQKREHDRLNDKYNDHTNGFTGQHDSNPKVYEAELAKYIEEKGISLYKANQNLTSWTKLEYDATSPNQLKPTDCE